MLVPDYSPPPVREGPCRDDEAVVTVLDASALASRVDGRDGSGTMAETETCSIRRDPLKIHVRSRWRQVEESVRSYIERRLLFSLGRFGSRVLRVTVQIVDADGPLGGAYQGVRIELRFRPKGTLFAEDADTDLSAAVDRAADKIAQAVARSLRRSREARDGWRPQPTKEVAREGELD